ncbi:hypothetical protein GWK08_17005 [Leptobacterium flavescens]|uniref:Uncharacterized protein n=1 Tax=Leptobacterium flavescens TaxID=472055 RepID=A0A6P0UQC3_9FLAO|nr:hypothetical protein [Leptobacterium flavescens]NER15157.1 hypothetical protein [Leptobacterium flavescens]
MRKLIHKLFLLSTLSIVFYGCEGSQPIDEVFDDISRGAILRTLSANNSYNIFDATSAFEAQLEESDLENGDLLSEVNLYISFVDNQDDGTDRDVAEQLFNSFAASELGISDSGLPLIDVSISLTEAVAAVGLSDGEFFGGDQFIFRFEVVLTDGRVFSSGNANSTVTGGSFFRSPFRYTVTIKCVPPAPVPGDYTIDLEDSFGDGWDGAFITVTIDGTSQDITINSGSAGTFVVNVPMGTTSLVFEYTPGNFESEHTYTITAPTGETAAEDGPGPTPGPITLNICNG